MVKHIFSGNIYTCFCVLVFYINVLADILTDHVLEIQLPIRIVLPVHRSLAIRFQSCSWSHCSLVFITSLLSVWTSLTLLNFLLKDTFVCICIQSPSLVRNRDYFSSVRTVNRLCYIYLTSYAFLVVFYVYCIKTHEYSLGLQVCVRLKLCVAGSEWISCSGNSPFLLSFEWGSWMNLSSPGLLNFQSSVTSKSGLPRTQLWFWLLQCTKDDHKCLPLPVGGPVTLGPAWDSRRSRLSRSRCAEVWRPSGILAWGDMDRQSVGWFPAMSNLPSISTSSVLLSDFSQHRGSVWITQLSPSQIPDSQSCGLKMVVVGSHWALE